MGGTRIVIDTRKAQSRLGELLARLREPRAGLALIGERLFRRAKESFEKQQSPEGIPWQPLSKRYAEFKAQRRPGRRILEWSGRLAGEIHWGIEGDTVFIATSPLPYAAIHQYGIYDEVTVRQHRRRVKSRDVWGRWEGRRRKIAYGIGFVGPFTRLLVMPARPYLGFPAVDEEATIKELEDYFARERARGGE